MTEEPERRWTQRWLPMTVFVWELAKAVGRALRHPVEPAVPPAALLEESGRPGDRNEDLEKGVNIERRKNWGTLIVLVCLAVTLAAGVGFQWVYWTNPENNLLLGGTLAMFLGGIGVGMVFYGRWLMIQKQATEPREVLPSSQEERDDTYETFTDAKHDVQRRTLLTWLATAGIITCAAAVVAYFRSLGTPPGVEIFDKVWKRGQRLMTVDNKPMTVDSLGIGDTAVVFPEDQIGSEHAQTVLVRVDPTLLRLPRERSDWGPQGYLAYSRVCTHAGCPVGLWEKTVCQLLCPCHQSTFDALRAGEPTGGPADRALPQLPLYIDSDGTLRAGGAFSEPPGPGFWGMPS
jgi:ubiquinol-cytochrome c reductase iron-sulfur subunit